MDIAAFLQHTQHALGLSFPDEPSLTSPLLFGFLGLSYMVLGNRPSWNVMSKPRRREDSISTSPTLDQLSGKRSIHCHG